MSTPLMITPCVKENAMKCAALTRSGHSCKGQAMTNGRCRMHGGTSPIGIASATVKTGRYSRHLPTRLLATYDQSRNDPDVLALHQEVALVDSRLAELLAAVDTGESLAAWDAIWTAIHAMERANARKDPDAAREAWQEIKGAAARGRGTSQAWRDVEKTIDLRRKLVESERKRIVEAKEVMTAEQAMLFVTALTAAVRDHVHDPDVLRAITADLGRIAPRTAA